MSDEDYADLLRNVLVSQSCLSGGAGQPSLLIHGLYIGGQRNAESYPSLERLGITHVVNCAGYKGNRSYHGSPYEGMHIKYIEFLADDTDHYDITQHFREAFAFIDRARKTGGVVLVHCALGINRSGATCMGYLMLMGRMNLIKAAILIKSKRRVVLSNVGFQKRLVRLARKNGLLDELDSAHVQRFVVSRPKHRSNSVSSNNLNELPDHQIFPHTFSGNIEFSSPFFPSYSNLFQPSTYQPSHLSSLNGYSAYNATEIPSVLTADEILGKGGYNRFDHLLKPSHQPRVLSLSRNSICFL